MPTLTEARRKLAQELGPFGVFTATGGSTTTLVCPNAFQSTELPTSDLAYAWIFVPGGTGARVRRVKASGLDPTSGTITVDAPFGAAVANGTVFEVSPRLPAAREPQATVGAAKVMGLLEALNLGLRHMLVPDTLQLLLVSGQFDYSLSAWSWLDRPERLREVRQLAADGSTMLPTWHSYELREDVDGQILHFDQPYRFTGGPFSNDLAVLRPGDSKVKVGGVWGDSTVGFVGETDEAGPDLNTVVDFGKVFVYQALARSRPGSKAADYAEDYVRQLQEARRSRYYDASNDIDSSVPAAPAGAAA